MKIRSFLAITAALLAGASAQASISFVLNGDALLNVGNINIPNGSAVFIVASLNGTFVNPTPGNYSVGSSWGSGNDVIIYTTGSTTENGGSGNESVVDTTPTLTFANGWTQGDRLALYWFSTSSYSITGTILAGGAPFGTFNNASIGDDASAWITPANGTSGYNLLFLTPGGFALGPGNDVGSFGSVTAVPESATFALLGGISTLGYSLYRRRQRTA